MALRPQQALANQKRRALKHDAFIEPVDKQVVYDAREGCCGICEKPVGFKAATLDHIVPLARGGLHCYANIQLAHDHCNRRKGVKLMEELDGSEGVTPRKRKKAYYNSRSYRAANTASQRRAVA